MKKYLVFLIGLVLSSILRAEPLPAKEAFQLEVQHTTPNAFTLHWTIKPGYFLYSERIHITPDKDSNLDVGALRLPQTLTKTDKQGHTYPIYRNQLRIPVDILGIKPGEALLRLTVQGCSDEGFCYPPERTDLIASIDRHLALSSVNVEDPSSEGMKTLNQHPSDNLSHVFSDHNGFMILLIFYGFGLLLSFTPCILPMIPVLSGIIVGHGNEVTTKKAFFFP